MLKKIINKLFPKNEKSQHTIAVTADPAEVLRRLDESMVLIRDMSIGTFFFSSLGPEQLLVKTKMGIVSVNNPSNCWSSGCDDVRGIPVSVGMRFLYDGKEYQAKMLSVVEGDLKIENT